VTCQIHMQLSGLRSIRLWAPLLLVAWASGAIAQSQTLLRVIGVDGAEMSLTAEVWAALPRQTVNTTDHAGVQVSFEGVPAREILKLAAAPLGEKLRGGSLSIVVVAQAADNYRVGYALTEFDQAFTDATILVADKKNGSALSANEGPLRMVVPWEKRPARWLRQLRVLRLYGVP
jgi:hypothetical protein